MHYKNHVESKEDEKALSGAVKKGLKDKVDDHNEKHGNSKTGKRVTLRMLEAVFRRGVGAYRTNPSSVLDQVLAVLTNGLMQELIAF